MAHVDAIGAARTLHRPLAHREDDPVALAQAHDLGARLHARPLLGQYELAAGEVASGLGEQDRDLERKDMRSVNVLVQAIVIAGAIAQQKRRRPHLTGGMASGAERLVLGGVANIDSHRRVPAVGERREPPIKAAAQPDDQVRQRIGEVFILAPAKTMARHHDPRAEAGVVRVKRRQGPAVLCRQQLRRDRAAERVELALERRPVEGVDPRFDDRTLIRPFGPPLPLAGEGWGEGLHHAASRAMSSRLRSTPHR
jgi:hypothetical protein